MYKFSEECDHIAHRQHLRDTDVLMFAKDQNQETLAKLEPSLPEWVKRDWRWNEIVVSCRRFK